MNVVSPLHSIWRRLPARARRQALYDVTAWLAPRAQRPAPAFDGTVVVAGEINRQSGLGQGARIMARALGQMGVPGGSLDCSGFSVRGVDWSGSGYTRNAALVVHVNSPQMPLAMCRLGRRAVRGHRIIGYWAWELPSVPAIWRAGLGCVHEIWVPSIFTARALEPLCPGHVRVVPHALAAAPPQPSALDRASFGLDPDAVVVLVSFSLASSFERKNPIAAINAFLEAFGDRPDRVLILKIIDGTHFPEDARRLQERVAGHANVRVETRTLPIEDSHALTRAADIVLSLHRSEGFGLVPAEAMMLGRTVIATDWSATAEFVDETCGMPVGYSLVPARDPRGVFEAPGAVWAEADIASAAALLRAAADDAGLRARLGAQARLRATSHFGLEPLAQALAGLGGQGRA